MLLYTIPFEMYQVLGIEICEGSEGGVPRAR